MIEGEDSLKEFTLIREYFSNIGASFLNKQGILKAVGDDAAVVRPPKNKELVVSVDTSIEGVHFFGLMKPDDIAYRSVAIALSDLAACGATPSWFTLSLTFKQPKKKWLEGFKKGLEEISEEFSIPLIGGDTTKGNLISISVQVGGYVDLGGAITREGAQIGDVIYVTGSIGEAAYARKILALDLGSQEKVVQTYLRPKIHINIGKALAGIATSAIDISDGLSQDLSHICGINHLSAKIYLAQIPSCLSKSNLSKFINSGDDYEICFTTKKKYRRNISSISKKLSVPITEIGEMSDGKGIILISSKGRIVPIPSGYNHFD